MTLNFFAIWTEKRPATAPLTNPFSNHIFLIVRNLSAGQFGTIPAKTTCANPTRQFKVTGQIRPALITGLQFEDLYP